MNIKSRLESTLDDLEASHEKEKRIRANVESEGRKVEGELKMTQESVADLERSKKEMEALIMRKDLAVQALSSKLEDEQGCVGRVQKGIKENQSRIEEMEEELEAERQATIEQMNAKLAQLEKAKTKVQIDLNDMAVQLEQAQILNASMEKKAKQFDRVVGEWKQKVDGLAMDLDLAQNECMNYSR